MSDNPLRAYGRWLAETSADWPDTALTSAHRQLIDTVAVMIPGSVTPAAQTALRLARRWGSGPCSVVGAVDGLAAPWAAMVNGTAGHALDFDDNFDPPKAHASTVLFPAIMAVAEEEGSAPGACLDAYIVGLQIQGRVGQGLNPTHRNRGWHATATTGALGAAAAASRLMRLDAQHAATALSIATSMAAGFMSQFGTMTKPLHAGLAAKAGVMAAAFGREGLTAGSDTLDGPTGMNTLMVGPDRESLRAAIVEPEHGQTLAFETDSVGEPLLITEHGFRVKRFPNCGSAHRAMDAVLSLREEHGFSAEQVERVDVHAPAVHLNNLMYECPEDGLQGKFSMEYGLACVLTSGNCTLADFTDEAVRRPGHRALYERIHRHPVDKLEGEFPTEVRIVLTDGRELSRTVAMPEGSKPAPFPTEQYWRKLEDCATGVIRAADQQRIAQLLADFTALERAGELFAALAIEPNGDALAASA